MKRLILMALLACCLALAGCEEEAPAGTPAPVWTPPPVSAAPASEEAASMEEALALCQEFVVKCNERYPQLQLSLEEDEIRYYQQQIAAGGDLSEPMIELSSTILRLRQGAFVGIDNIRKMGDTPPEGLEAFLEEYEARFLAIGW